jgi:hypothetical protein
VAQPLRVNPSVETGRNWRVPQARSVCLGLGFLSLRSAPQNLRVPHPWFIRVGSYDRRPFFSSLLGLSCPCRARLLPARRRREAGRQLHAAHHLARLPHNCHPDPAGRDPIFSSAPLSGASGLSPSCHPDRSNGTFCRCAVEGSAFSFSSSAPPLRPLRYLFSFLPLCPLCSDLRAPCVRVPLLLAS